MMKSVLLLTIAALLSACAGTPHDERYVTYEPIRGERVRIPPCNPFYADQLMGWATELEGGQYHKRRARARVDTRGFVTCNSSEVAGSHSRGR